MTSKVSFFMVDELLRYGISIRTVCHAWLEDRPYLLKLIGKSHIVDTGNRIAVEIKKCIVVPTGASTVLVLIRRGDPLRFPVHDAASSSRYYLLCKVFHILV